MVMLIQPEIAAMGERWFWTVQPKSSFFSLSSPRSPRLPIESGELDDCPLIRAEEVEDE